MKFYFAKVKFYFAKVKLIERQHNCFFSVNLFQDNYEMRPYKENVDKREYYLALRNKEL